MVTLGQMDELSRATFDTRMLYHLHPRLVGLAVAAWRMLCWSLDVLSQTSTLRREGFGETTEFLLKKRYTVPQMVGVQPKPSEVTLL